MVIFRKQVAGLSEASLARFAVRAGRAAKLRGAVQILVTGNREMQSLNRRFRAHDRPTDVLSFPAGSFPAETASQKLAGDIAISAEIAARNARLLKHSCADEIKVLVLHGILHLAGYDHETDSGAMARKEMQMRRALRLPCGLIERNDSPARNAISGTEARSKSRKRGQGRTPARTRTQKRSRQ